MKRYIILIIALICTFNSFAQWKGSYVSDSYTDEKYPQITFDLNDPIGLVKYVNSTLRVVLLYSKTDNFDLWWNSQMNDNGWIKYTSNIDLNFIGNDPIELNLSGEIGNYKKDHLYFAFFFNDPEELILNALKANNKLKIRYYDIVLETTNILDIPLNGVSAQCKKVGL